MTQYTIGKSETSIYSISSTDISEIPIVRNEPGPDPIRRI